MASHHRAAAEAFMGHMTRWKRSGTQRQTKNGHVQHVVSML